MLDIAEAFFTWTEANNVPFWIVLSALIGSLFGAGIVGLSLGIWVADKLHKMIKKAPTK